MLAGCAAGRTPEPTPDLALIYARALQTVLATASAATSQAGFIPVTGGEALPAPPLSPADANSLATSAAATAQSLLTSTPPTATLSPLPSATATVTSTPTRSPTPSITPTRTITPTASITATRTITPTASITPTRTLTPTVTPTASATPQVFQGNGSGTVSLPFQPVGVLHITHGAGPGTFKVTGYGALRQSAGTLVSTSGAYEGRVPINLLLEQQITRLEVLGSGPWGIRYYPILSYDHWADTASTLTGRSDDVWFAHGRRVQSLAISGNEARRVFSVLVLGSDGYQLAVNTIDPYHGTFTMPSNLGALYGIVVTASDDWQITLSP